MRADGRARAAAGHPLDRWIPWLFVAFFGVIFLANGIFVYLALDSWTGLTSENAYEEGRTYDQQIAAGEAAENLGWRADVEYRPTDGGYLEARLVDRTGAPLDGLEVTVEVGRPTHDDEDRGLGLEPRGGGRYVAPVALGAGQWAVHLRAADQSVSYEIRRKVLVR